MNLVLCPAKATKHQLGELGTARGKVKLTPLSGPSPNESLISAETCGNKKHQKKIYKQPLHGRPLETPQHCQMHKGHSTLRLGSW